MKLTDEMQRVVLEQRLGFHATVSPDGRPNLSPKGTTTVYDDEHLLFAEIRSPQTIANLRRNPAIDVNVVDPILRRGYRFRGRGTIHEEGEVYERSLALLAERGIAVTPEQIRAIVLIAVDEAEPLTSPAYDTGASEAEVAAWWRERVQARLDSLAVSTRVRA
jgi:predicted pyridoxine 5'-phosphate oxidase superfamily flavin-nucleotide-binding protein